MQAEFTAPGGQQSGVPWTESGGSVYASADGAHVYASVGADDDKVSGLKLASDGNADMVVLKR